MRKIKNYSDFRKSLNSSKQFEGFEEAADLILWGPQANRGYYKDEVDYVKSADREDLRIIDKFYRRAGLSTKLEGGSLLPAKTVPIKLDSPYRFYQEFKPTLWRFTKDKQIEMQKVTGDSTGTLYKFIDSSTGRLIDTNQLAQKEVFIDDLSDADSKKKLAEQYIYILSKKAIVPKKIIDLLPDNKPEEVYTLNVLFPKGDSADKPPFIVFFTKFDLSNGGTLNTVVDTVMTQDFSEPEFKGGFYMSDPNLVGQRESNEEPAIVKKIKDMFKSLKKQESKLRTSGVNYGYDEKELGKKTPLPVEEDEEKNWLNIPRKVRIEFANLIKKASNGGKTEVENWDPELKKQIFDIAKRYAPKTFAKEYNRPEWFDYNFGTLVKKDKIGDTTLDQDFNFWVMRGIQKLSELNNQIDEVTTNPKVSELLSQGKTIQVGNGGVKKIESALDKLKFLYIELPSPKREEESAGIRQSIAKKIYNFFYSEKVDTNKEKEKNSFYEQIFSGDEKMNWKDVFNKVENERKIKEENWTRAENNYKTLCTLVWNSNKPFAKNKAGVKIDWWSSIKNNLIDLFTSEGPGETYGWDWTVKIGGGKLKMPNDFSNPKDVELSYELKRSIIREIIIVLANLGDKKAIAEVERGEEMLKSKSDLNQSLLDDSKRGGFEQIFSEITKEGWWDHNSLAQQDRSIGGKFGIPKKMYNIPEGWRNSKIKMDDLVKIKDINNAIDIIQTFFEEVKQQFGVDVDTVRGENNIDTFIFLLRWLAYFKLLETASNDDTKGGKIISGSKVQVAIRILNKAIELADKLPTQSQSQSLVKMRDELAKMSPTDSVPLTTLSIKSKYDK